MRNERQKFYSPTGAELYEEYSSHLLERIIPAYDRLFHGTGIKIFSIQEESLEAYALQKWDIPPWNIYNAWKMETS